MKKPVFLLILALALAPLSACGRVSKNPDEDAVIRTLSAEEKDEIEAELADFLTKSGCEYEELSFEYGDKPFIYEIHVNISEELAQALQKDLKDGSQVLSDDFDGHMTALAKFCEDKIAEKGFYADAAGVVTAGGADGAFRNFDKDRVW